MTKFLISFPASAMDVPAEDMPAVADAAHAVIREAKAAGVYVFGGGINGEVAPVMVAADGICTTETYRPTREFDGAFVCSSYRPGQLPFNGPPRSLGPAAVHKSFASSTTTLKADLEQLEKTVGLHGRQGLRSIRRRAGADPDRRKLQALNRDEKAEELFQCHRRWRTEIAEPG